MGKKLKCGTSKENNPSLPFLYFRIIKDNKKNK